ncbi:hypothetical protein LSAT2_003793, partial [Lamellibrachia satsuma]
MLIFYSWFVLSDKSRSIVRDSFFGNPFKFLASVNLPSAVAMLISVIFAETMFPPVLNAATTKGSLKGIRGFLKIFDGIYLIAYVLFIVAWYTKDADTARPWYCISLILCYAYFMKVLIVFERIGPKIYMIRLMV